MPITCADEADELMELDAGTVILGFWSGKTAIGRRLPDVLAAVAHAFEDAPISFYEVDTDAHPEVQRAFGIRCVPSIMMLQNGEMVEAIVGRCDAESVKRRAKGLIARQQATERSWLGRLLG